MRAAECVCTGWQATAVSLCCADAILVTPHFVMILTAARRARPRCTASWPSWCCYSWPRCVSSSGYVCHSYFCIPTTSSLTLSRAGPYSARRRSGSRRSTRSAAGVASSNPGARESATTHGAARAHTATPGPPTPRFSVSSHSLVFLSSLCLPGSGLSPPTVARCRKGRACPALPRYLV